MAILHPPSSIIHPQLFTPIIESTSAVNTKIFGVCATVAVVQLSHLPCLLSAMTPLSSLMPLISLHTSVYLPLLRPCWLTLNLPKCRIPPALYVAIARGSSRL